MQLGLFVIIESKLDSKGVCGLIGLFLCLDSGDPSETMSLSGTTGCLFGLRSIGHVHPQMQYCRHNKIARCGCGAFPY